MILNSSFYLYTSAREMGCLPRSTLFDTIPANVAQILVEVVVAICAERGGGGGRVGIDICFYKFLNLNVTFFVNYKNSLWLTI
ncbi:hypothetical protein Hanom_Chr01g00091551 [Helianthus anomalus]